MRQNNIKERIKPLFKIGVYGDEPNQAIGWESHNIFVIYPIFDRRYICCFLYFSFIDLRLHTYLY